MSRSGLESARWLFVFVDLQEISKIRVRAGSGADPFDQSNNIEENVLSRIFADFASTAYPNSVQEVVASTWLVVLQNSVSKSTNFCGFSMLRE